MPVGDKQLILRAFRLPDGGVRIHTADKSGDQPRLRQALRAQSGPHRDLPAVIRQPPAAQTRFLLYDATERHTGCR